MMANVRIEITAGSAEEARRHMQELIGNPQLRCYTPGPLAGAEPTAAEFGTVDETVETEQAEQPAAEAPKRRRRTKAEIEADKAAEEAAAKSDPPAVQPEKAPANDGAMPEFLRRDEPAPIAETAEQPSAKKRYAIFYPSGEKFSDVGLDAAVKRLLEWGDVADADGLAALIEANKATLAEMPSDERRHVYAQWDARAQDLEKGAPAMTYDDAKAALVAAAAKPNGTAAALAVLKELGANKISELEPHRFAEFIDKLRAATGHGEAA